MDTNNQNIMVRPRTIVTNKDTLEEIKRLFQEEINIDPECISLYDSSHPKLNEIKFVEELASTYNVDKNKIINRIKAVRNINKLIKLEQNNKVKKLTN